MRNGIIDDIHIIGESIKFLNLKSLMKEIIDPSLKV